jgi:hypothetical protein
MQIEEKEDALNESIDQVKVNKLLKEKSKLAMQDQNERRSSTSSLQSISSSATTTICDESIIPPEKANAN